jgi:hypothetical protein
MKRWLVCDVAKGRLQTMLQVLIWAISAQHDSHNNFASSCYRLSPDSKPCPVQLKQWSVQHSLALDASFLLGYQRQHSIVLPHHEAPLFSRWLAYAPLICSICKCCQLVAVITRSHGGSTKGQLKVKHYIMLL